MKRKVIRIGLCPWCSQEEESIAHAIWFCLAERAVWNASHSIFHKTAFLNSTFMDNFRCCMNRFNKLEMSILHQ
jgi:hypothetical protein